MAQGGSRWSVLIAGLSALGRLFELGLSALTYPPAALAMWVWRRGLGRIVVRAGEALVPTGFGEPSERTATPSSPGQPAAAQHARSGDADRSGEPTQPHGSAQPDEPARPGEPARPAVSLMVMAAYVLTVAAAAVLVVLNRVDGALQQMYTAETSGGGALRFPGSLRDLTTAGTAATADAVDRQQAGWRAFEAQVDRTDVLRGPFEIARTLVLLDLVFIALYAVVLGLLLTSLYRGTRRAVSNPRTAGRLERMLGGSGAALLLLVAVDLVEDWQLWTVVATDRGPVTPAMLAALPGGLALGPLASLLKVVLTAAVLGPVVIAAGVQVAERAALRHAIASARGVVVLVAVLAGFLMTGIGAHQFDDVVRAWSAGRAAAAVLACALLAVAVAAVTRTLTRGGGDHPAPDVGSSAQPLVLGTGVALVVAGLLLSLTGYGWGLAVAGGLFGVLWLLGLPLDGLSSWRDLAERRTPPVDWRLPTAVAAAGGFAAAVLAAVLGLPVVWFSLLGVLLALVGLAAYGSVRWGRGTAAAGDARADAPAPAGEDAGGREGAQRPSAGAGEGGAQPREPDAPDPVVVAREGDRLGRVLGGVVAAVLVVVIFRGTALDVAARVPTDLGLLAAPWTAAGALLVVGAVVCGVRLDPLGRRLGRWRAVWPALATLGAVLLAVVQAPPDVTVTRAEAIGSVAILFGAIGLLVAAVGVLAGLFRGGPFVAYELAPALRVVRLRRFPVLAFLVAWVMAMAVLDPGGFHDIRRDGGGPADPAPTLARAWADYLGATPGAPGGTGSGTGSGGAAGGAGAARPVVLVAAEGGGIRSAVWTALVMECLFGPGPVRDSGTVCARGGGPVTSAAAVAAAAREPLPVFLASGASGGSVGLAAWSARRADLLEDGGTSGTPLRVEDALDRDFLAADVAGLFLADLPHALLGWDKPDRAELLERAWESTWQAGPAPQDPAQRRGLARGLRRLWDVSHGQGRWGTPVLALNGTSVEDTCRFLASAVDFTLPASTYPAPGQRPEEVAAKAVSSRDDLPDDAACRGPKRADGAAVDVLPSTTELVDVLCPGQDVPLSTAAHLSARFPYVSPTGRVERTACADGAGLVPAPAVSYDSDGGIFDNSGAGTAVDAWRALEPLAAAVERQSGSCLVPLFVQIDNSPPAETISSSRDGRPFEVTAPVGATQGQSGSRETYARAGAASAFARAVSPSGKSVTVDGSAPQLWWRVVLYGQPGPEPPLGWTLAAETIGDMRRELRSTRNAEALAGIRDLLSAGRLQCR